MLNVDSKEPQPPIYSLCFYGNDLYVGGGFTQTYEPTSAQGIMKYNISSGWETLTTEGSSSTGVNNCIYTFAVNGTEGKIYIGGYFTTAGGKAAVNIAYFMDTSNQPPDDPVDPTPFVVTNTGGSVKEGGFFIFNDLILNSNDNDGPSYSITYVIQNDPNHGQLINGTASSVSSRFTFTQNDIANGKVKYVHNGDESSTDNFSFTLVDSDGNVSPVYTFNIIVTGVNDPHYLTGLPKIEFPEDVPYLMPIDVLYKYLYDPDDNNTSLNIELFSLSDSLLCQASGDTAWVFCGKENMFGKFKTRVSISDGEYEVDTTFYVTVVPINDIPVITGIPDKIEFIVTGSGSIHLNGCATDVETPDSLLTYSFICEPDSINFHYNPKTCLVTLTSKNGFIGNASLCIHIEDTDNGVCDKTINITVKDDPTGVKQITGIPEEYRLYQNYPNPFNPSTIIRYGIPVGDVYNVSRNVLLKVYDILGNEVVTLVDGQQTPGYYEVKWNASNLSSGIYFYIISVNGGKTYMEVRKMLLIK